MDYTNTSQRDKRAVLEHVVLTKSPDEIRERYRQLGHVENSARALGLACRFRGLEYVRALVESGADFTYVRPENEGGYYTIYYWLSPLDMNSTLLEHASFLNRWDACFGDVVTEMGKSISVLPIEQRIEIVQYLYEHREKVCIDAGEMLYYAIMSDNKQIASVLRESGAVFSERRITGITAKGRSFQWLEFCSMSDSLKDDRFLEVIGAITEEIGGKKLYYTEAVYWGNYNDRYRQYRLYKPEFFRFILEHYDQKKMNKSKLMKGAIDQNSVECLLICAENGWLDMPRRRDEMIKYASENGQAECSAWLLEYKNRTADFAAEREKAEKKMMRGLNANPNSVTELKKVWGYDTCEDGTIVIRRYRGKRTQIDVPEMIGGRIVAAIGERAFSPNALRLKEEQVDLRMEITRITLPETIQTIGEKAFEGCWALAEINIPDRVTAVGVNAFYNCFSLVSIKLPEGINAIEPYTFGKCQSLQSVDIPRSVVEIRKWAFNGCSALETVVVPEGVAQIGQLAFAGCRKLKSVVLPESIRKIKNDTRKGHTPRTIFGDNTNVTVTVVPKSYAEKYCRRNNIKYVYQEN